MLSFIDFIKTPFLKEIIISQDGKNCSFFKEGKWIDGRFERNIRIDHPGHGVGQDHAHIYGRNKKKQIGVVNITGTPSHGTKIKLHKKDAEALKAKGFDIPPNRIVEWILIENCPGLLLG